MFLFALYFRSLPRRWHDVRLQLQDTVLAVRHCKSRRWVTLWTQIKYEIITQIFLLKLSRPDRRHRGMPAGEPAVLHRGVQGGVGRLHPGRAHSGGRGVVAVHDRGLDQFCNSWVRTVHFTTLYLYIYTLKNWQYFLENVTCKQNKINVYISFLYIWIFPFGS